MSSPRPGKDGMNINQTNDKGKEQGGPLGKLFRKLTKSITGKPSIRY
jgi:hypothetical protein